MPSTTFRLIIYHYLNFVYPAIPVIYLLTFQRRLSTRDYEHDLIFFRLCLSICAATVSSVPRKISIFGFGYYDDSREFVSRAYLLMMASRFTSSLDWTDTPSLDNLLCSYLLAYASHYTDKPSRAWILMNESLQICRNMRV
jgi:hypothetical protein